MSRPILPWSCHTLAMNTARERSMITVLMTNVRCFVIQAAVLLATSMCKWIASVVKNQRGSLAQSHLEACISAKICALEFWIASSTHVRNNVIKVLAKLVTWTFKQNASVEKRKEQSNVVVSDLFVIKYAEKHWTVANTIVKRYVTRDPVSHVRKLHQELNIALVEEKRFPLS